MENSIPKWTGDAVKKMHLNSIDQTELASELGWNRSYLWKVLNGHRTPKNAMEKVMKAIDMIASKKEHNAKSESDSEGEE